MGAFAVFYLCINAFPWIATAGAIIGEAGLLLLLLKKKPGFIVFILGGVLCALSLCGSVSASAFWIALLVLSVVLLFLVMATFGFLQVKNKQGCSGWSLLRPLSSKSSLPKEQSGEKRYRYLLTQICIGIVLPFVLVILAEPGFRAMFFSVIKPFKVTGSIGGHDYVDLGLPSGLMWASCNMGADSPQDGGCFYSWGETITKDFYDYSNYSYSSKPDTLPLSDDVAYTEWGAYWRMPSREDLRELMDNCAFRFVKVKGVRGVKVISKKNGNWIFIPSAGWYMQNSLENKDVVASFWSSSDEPSRSDVVLHFSAYEGEPSISTSVPYWGNTVRPVTRLIPLNEQKISK